MCVVVHASVGLELRWCYWCIQAAAEEEKECFGMEMGKLQSKLNAASQHEATTRCSHGHTYTRWCYADVSDILHANRNKAHAQVACLQGTVG